MINQLTANNSFLSWISTTNQLSGILNLLTDGVLSLPGSMTFSNTGLNITAQGLISIANNLILTAPSGNSLIVSSTNGVFKRIYLSGDLVVNNTVNIWGNLVVPNALTINNSTWLINSFRTHLLTTNNVASILINVTNSIITNNLIVSNTSFISTNAYANTVTIPSLNSTNSLTGTNLNVINVLNANANVNTSNLIVSKNVTVGGSLTVVNNTTLSNNSNIGFITGGTFTNANFTGIVTTTLQTPTDNSTNLATTSFTYPAYNNTGRNLLHNPLFTVNQRAFAFAKAGYFNAQANSQFTADRWWITANSTGDTANVNLAVPIANNDMIQIKHENVYNVATITFTGGLTSNSFISFGQSLENLKRFGNKNVTLSFYANSSTTMNLGLNVVSFFGAGATTANITNSTILTISANTWNRYNATFFIPSTIGQGFGLNPTMLQTQFILSNPTSAVGTQSNTIKLWGTQLEFGNTVTPLEFRDPGTELNFCQRFYLPQPNVGMAAYIAVSNSGQNNARSIMIPFPTTMITPPTKISISLLRANNNGFMTYYPPNTASYILTLTSSQTSTNRPGAYSTIELSSEI